MFRVQVIFALFAVLCVGVTEVIGAVTPSVQQKLLDSHNKYRKLVLEGKVPGQPKAQKMPQLTWHTGLARLAQRLADSCVFEHDTYVPNSIPEYESIGQNIAKYSGMNYDAVKGWFDEYKDYNYQQNSCSRMCGHYTQIVWADTTKVGCGVAKCGMSTHVVCNYGPAGNYIGEKPYVAEGGNIQSANPPNGNAVTQENTQNWQPANDNKWNTNDNVQWNTWPTDNGNVVWKTQGNSWNPMKNLNFEKIKNMLNNGGQFMDDSWSSSWEEQPDNGNHVIRYKVYYNCEFIQL